MSNCKNCNTKIKKPNIFCSHSCSASFNNKKRNCRTETKDKISNGLKTFYNTTEKFINRYNENPKICVNCFSKIPFDLKRNKTCSEKCAKERSMIGSIKGGLKTASMGIKRSKNEIALYELCYTNYNNVTCNDPYFDGWDADILLHDHKIAILWNGDWHYVQMNIKGHSLKQVQARDTYKGKLISKYGWKLIIFEDSTKNPLNPKDAFEYLRSYIDDLYGRPNLI